MNRRISLLALLTFFAINALNAQINKFQFSKLDITNGLSSNQVNCILKDNKGFMWFGTFSGLNKYDGYTYKIFKHEEGDTASLDDDFIVNIYEGPNNKLWIETHIGFNIYDPLTEKFSHDVSGYLHTINIPESSISAIKKDRDGDFWFLTSNSGLYKYSPRQKITQHASANLMKSNEIFSNSIADLAYDSKGGIWLIYNKGVIERIDPLKLEVNYRAKIKPMPSGITTKYKVFIDNEDDVWAFVPTYSSGVYYLNIKKNVVKHLDKGTSEFNLNTNVVSNLVQDEIGRIWIATDHGGINVLGKNDFKIKYILSEEDDNKSVGQNSIIFLYKDNTGIIWAGTYKAGVSYYHRSIVKFPLYTHYLSDPESLSFSDVNRFVEDKKGNLWLGTNGGGLIYFNRQTGIFKRYLHKNNNSNSLSNNVITSMCLDHEQKLWIGTYFGGLDCFDGSTFKHYRHNDAITGSLSEDRVWSILEDSDNKLWVGTLAGGLNLLNRKTNSFTHYRVNKEDKNSIKSNYISSILEDRRKNIWIITYYGVDVFNKKTNQFTHYEHEKNNSNSLVNNNTNNILEDSSGLIWISTRGGISIYNPANATFKSIYKRDGLPDNTVMDMREDNHHNIWVSTPNGLSNIIVNRKSRQLEFDFINYNEKDGLQGREFTANSSYKTRDGELIFGGSKGFNIFKPENLRPNKNNPALVFTDLQVFNKSISVGESIYGKVILLKSITESNNIELKYDENVFSIEFASLNYFDPDKVKFEYKMEGFDKDWIISDNRIRKATYTNLDPGEYTFQVRASDTDFWKNKQIEIHVKILPPIWKTTYAYIIYLIFFVGALFLIRRRGIKKLRAQFLTEKEREKIQRMHDLDLMKIKFFTNVSHEFRTPLSLILAPADRIMKEAKEPGLKQQILLINRNAKRLLNMVNQLLDFRKMEYQELKLYKRPGEIISFLKELSYSFTDIAEQKNITFIFDTDAEEFYTSFDHDKVERIMFNLLSNAYKFTPAKGRVSVLISLKSHAIDFEDLEIRVTDSGIGMQREKVDKIFEPFFQNDIPGSLLNQGSGIGLSITKEFVKLHGGEMLVETEIGSGSCFTIILPLQELNKSIVAGRPGLIEHISEKEDMLNQLNSKTRENHDKKKQTVLIIEDNDDFRFYLKENLKESFNIIEAENGKRGWQKTLAKHPDLIVSDVSMPEMNGIDLCIKIKSDKRTAHLPMILITAVAGEEQQLKGLETGASDYMTKPFNFEILLFKIRGILNQQEQVIKSFQNHVDVTPSEIQVESPDEAFINKVIKVIETNISNQNFSIEELSNEVFVSRYTLYRKILQMTGKTPNELVRQMRLKCAAQLLETGLNVSQICYKVGFKDQKYFVKTFKAEHGVIPSKYLEHSQIDAAK